MFEDLNITDSLKLREKITDKELERICAEIRNRINNLTQPDPIASVVVSAYNEEMYMLSMLIAMSHLQTQYPVEFIGVNNASTDRTGRIFEMSGFKTFIENTKGISYGRQLGLSVARGEYVFTTDADTLVPSTWINGSLKYFEEQKNLGLLSGGIHSKFLGALPIHNMLRFGAGILRKIRGKNKEATRFFPGANSVFKRDIALEVGGYKLGSDRGEDNILALEIGKVAELLKVDDDPRIRVITSGRRLSTLPLLGKMLQERALDVLRIDENTRQNRTFTDVR